MSPQRPSEPEFETSVLDEFRLKLLEFCSSRHDGGRVDPGRLDVVITVVTAWSVPKLREVLRPYATRILNVELAGARLDDVVFAVDEHLPAPWRHVSVKGRQRDPSTPIIADDGPPGPQYPVLVFTLAYERDYRYVFPIAETASWLAIRRGPAAHDDRYEIPLPNHLFAVPAGSLLHLRYWQGQVDLRRAEVRTEYSVQVDGHWLAPGQQIRLLQRGYVAYAVGERRTVLKYLLKERE